MRIANIPNLKVFLKKKQEGGECCYEAVYLHVNKIYDAMRLKETRGKKRLKKNFVAKVVAGHRVTIPKEICEVLQIEEGDLVDVDVSRIPLNPHVKSEVKGRNC